MKQAAYRHNLPILYLKMELKEPEQNRVRMNVTASRPKVTLHLVHAVASESSGAKGVNLFVTCLTDRFSVSDFSGT
jgi:hypothetical protein